MILAKVDIDDLGDIAMQHKVGYFCIKALSNYFVTAAFEPVLWHVSNKLISYFRKHGILVAFV